MAERLVISRLVRREADLWIEADPENGRRTLAAVKAFGDWRAKRSMPSTARRPS